MIFKRWLLFWLEPLCWLVGHDVIKSPNRYWWYCHRCWKRGAGIEAMMASRK